MKKFAVFLVILASCTSRKAEKHAAFPAASAAENEWAAYEGIIVTDKGLDVRVEISLREAAVGFEAGFKMNKEVNVGGEYYSQQSMGNYSISYGLPGHEQGITIKDRPIKLRKPSTNGRAKSTAEGSEALFRKFAKSQDLLLMPEVYLRTAGNERLVQTNRSFDDKGAKYVLYKRSNLFTVEGYVSCENSKTEFFERNAREAWNVSPLGEIDSVKIKYIELATEEHEGIYLKALAYSIADTAAPTNRSLVIKKVLRIEKSSIENPIK